MWNACSTERVGHALAVAVVAVAAVAAASAGLLWSGSARASPAAVEPFTREAWTQWRDAPVRPSVVVFTTTDCAYCPAVVAALRRELAQGRLRSSGAELAAVVMDVKPGAADDALLADAHYRPADRLLAFDGPAAALRHAVEPRWRGVTPAVALLAPGVAPRWVVGAPRDAQLEEWAQALRVAKR